MPGFVETMAYAGKTPWHGLGTYVGDEDVDSARMLEAAGLNWGTQKVPAGFKDPQDGSYMEVPDQFVVVRDTDKQPLGITGKLWTPFENRDCFEFLDSLKDDGEQLLYHTAGALHQGQKVWALIQMKGQMEIEREDGEKDVTAPFLLLYTGHDGKTPIILRYTAVRVVCWNTATVALHEGGRHEFRIRHTASAKEKVEEARKALRLSSGYFQTFAKQMQELENERMERQEYRAFVEKLLFDTERDIEHVKEQMTDRSRQIFEHRVGELEELFENGTGNRGKTRFDAFNSVTEWVDHKRIRGKEGAERLRRASQATESAWMGTGANRKQRALRLLTRG